MKKLSKIFAASLITIFCVGYAANYVLDNEIAVKPVPTYETDNTNFVNGEVLIPDYVHSDTLIVTDAKFINWAMEYYDAGSDGDIADILAQGTIKY